ncbi:MAG: GNAT family N-acetyltransferase [Microbacterium sp.]|nr:GNAT family N-acetyltransferase [Microbacterium sp.]
MTDTAGTLLARRGGVVAEGVASFAEYAPGESEALWGSLRRHTLELVCADGADHARREAVGEVLDRWLELAAETEEPGDEESSCTLTLPSADSALVRTVLSRGFAPVTIDAVRRLAATPPTEEETLGDGVVLRRATASDLDALAAFDARLLAHEADFGAVTWREGAEDVLRSSMRGRLSDWPHWTWLIEQDGRSVGYVHAFPDHPDAVDSPSPAYLDAMYLASDVRGVGLGRRVVDAVHGALARQGATAVRLDYSVANSQSGPFWSRVGYRPLTTTWQRRPAVR